MELVKFGTCHLFGEWLLPKVFWKRTW